MSQKEENSNALKVIAGLLGVAFLGALIWGILNYQTIKKNQKIAQQEKELVLEDLESLKSEYDKAILESQATNEELVDARNNITKYMDSLQSMKADLATLYKYRRQVTRLKQEREVLLRKVDSLTQSNTLLAMQRDSTYQELELQARFNDSLVVQNTQLADAVERGGALNLATFNVDAVRERSSGKLVSVTRARQTDKLKVCFTVSENRIALAGDREFYIEVLDPQGNVLGEGYTQMDEEGKTISYSKATTFYYENNNLDVCDYINKPESDFQSGNYLVTVYDEDLRLLGTSKFILK